MKRILLDIDGVLGDIYSRFLELHREETGEILTYEDISGKLEGEAFPGLYRWVRTVGFFRTIPVMPDSQQILRRLNEWHEIIIVSMATEFPESLTDKQLWLNEHYPFIKPKQVIFCGDKSLIPGDIMIDDHFKNLDRFGGETIMFVQPHNVLKDDHSHRKVSSWKEIESLLLPRP
jgi:5'-nucleotidase